MVEVLTSRFSVLPIDDDGDTSRRIKLKKSKQKPEDKPSSAPKKQDPKKQKDKKKQPQQQASSSSTKPKPKNKTDAKKKSQEQWETWQKKDAEFVDGHYENDLQEAMHLSMLDYEEKKEIYDELKKQAEEEKKSGNKKNKKSNKPQTMSLGEFQSGNSSQIQVETKLNGGDFTNGDNEVDTEFFAKVEKEAKKAFQAEKAEEKRKARQPVTDEMISIAQYQDQLDKYKEEIKRLNKENSSLKEDILNVKTRNKNLYKLLSQGEMQDKAELLVEVDKLQKVKDELSDEVSSLAGQLEQEKSKVRALTAQLDAKANSKNKKRTESK